MMVEDLIEKYRLHEMLGSRIGTQGKPSPEELAFLRGRKEELLRKIREQTERKRKEKAKEEERKYAPLRAKLPPLPNLKNTPDPGKFRGIMAKIRTDYFSGPEDDGLNYSIAAGNSRIRREAQQYCSHEIRVSFYHTYTADARLRLERTVECPRCGFFQKDVVSEELSR